MAVSTRGQTTSLGFFRNVPVLYACHKTMLWKNILLVFLLLDSGRAVCNRRFKKEIPCSIHYHTYDGWRETLTQARQWVWLLLSWMKHVFGHLTSKLLWERFGTTNCGLFRGGGPGFLCDCHYTTCYCIWVKMCWSEKLANMFIHFGMQTPT